MEGRGGREVWDFRFLGGERSQNLSKGCGEGTRIDKKLKTQRTEMEIPERVMRNGSQGIAEEKRRGVEGEARKEEKGRRRGRGGRRGNMWNLHQK